MSTVRIHEVRIDRSSVNVEFVEIVALLKTDGSRVSVDDELLEYETSKGVVVVTAEARGVFHTPWTVGSEVPMNQALGFIEQDSSLAAHEGDAR